MIREASVLLRGKRESGEAEKRGILGKVKMGKALQLMRNKDNAHQEQTYRSMQA